MIDNHQVTVISGETGCGKTTQVTQFILDNYIERGKGSACRIVCTQPRRISAISVSNVLLLKIPQFMSRPPSLTGTTLILKVRTDS